MTEKPITGKVFEVPEQFLNHLLSIEDKGLADEIWALCEQIKRLVVDLGISDEYIGFITDRDLAIPWKDCFSEGNQFEGVFWTKITK